MGCDPVRTTRQTVRIVVTDSQSKMPASNITVRLKDEFTLSPDTKDYHHLRRSWESFPWFTALTDENGSAIIHVEYTAIDGTRSQPPPDSRDWVAGKSHIVEIGKQQNEFERVTLLMNGGAEASGSRYNILIESITPPKYTSTK